MTVTVRLFAAARTAVGASEVQLDAPGTIQDALDSLRAAAVAEPDRVAATLARCSFLLNRVATTDRGRPLADGDVLDVLPPFAGG